MNFPPAFVDGVIVFTLFEFVFLAWRHQRTGRGLGVKHNPGLLQNPRLDALMVHAQQVKRAHAVVLLCGCARLVALNLRHHPGGHLQPFGQAGKRAAQAMQGQAL